MKRKLFNAALFAAVLVAAPVSTFVSCADYDSDIENLQNQKNDLEALLLQKEQVLNDKIATLEAENDALEAAYKAADAALTQALADNKTELLGEIATCKAECEAAMDNLKTLIGGLRTDLDALKKQHDKDVETLLAADKELSNAIAAANTAIENLETRLNARIEALETLTSTHTTEIANLKSTLEDVVKDIKKVREEFAAADAALDKKFQGKIDDLWKQVNDNKDAIEKEVTARENAIKELTKVVNDNKKACDDAVKELQDKDAELAGLIQTLTNDFNAYKDFNDAEVKDLKNRMDAVEGQVSVNTKAILDLAARVVDLCSGLDQLKASLEAAKAAQALVDEAQNLAIQNLIDTKANKSELTEQVNLLKDLINTNTEALNKLTERVTKNEEDIDVLYQDLGDLRTEFEEAKMQIKTEIYNLKLADNEIRASISELTEQLKNEIARVETDYKAADDAILATLEESIKNLNKTLTDLIEQYAKELSAEVKGFVLVPDNYYEGIQAIEGDVYKYHPWNVDGTKAFPIKKDFVEFCPEVVANYNVNPSTATLSEDTQYYSYTVEDRVNRGNNKELLPVIKEVKQDGGLLTVHMSITDPTKNQTPSNLAEQAFSNNKVTVMALQYENPAAKDSAQVVTSDYAVLYLEELCGVNLLYSYGRTDVADFYYHTEKRPPHNFVQPKLTEVKYYETQNIEELIITKFGLKDPSTTLPEGFYYSYTAVEGATTNFNADDLAKGVINPQLRLDNEGNEVEATIACIGKKIRVRVDVMNGDNVAEVGYLDFVIVGDAVVEEANKVETTEDYNVTCLDYTSQPALSVTLSAENVWKKIAEVTNVTDEENKKEYNFVLIPSSNYGAELQQYSKKEDKKFEESTGYGNVVLNEDSTLTWTITYGQLNGKLPPLTTYVLVRSKEVYATDNYNEFYLPLTWNPSDIEKWGGQAKDGVETAKWSYTKVKNAWQTRPDGEEEIRLYADLSVEGNTPFTFQLSNALYNSKVELHNKDKFTNYESIKPVLEDEDENTEKTGFIFIDLPTEYQTMTGVSETKYTLKVSEDGKQLLAFAEGKEVATRATSTTTNGEVIATITREGEINLQNTEATQDLLNKYEKTQLNLGQTLAARVSYAVTSCAGKVEVTEGDFYVRFIKPVTKGETTITFADATSGTYYADLATTLVCFNGDTLDKLNNGKSYFDLFAGHISVDPLSTWTTNYDGHTDFDATLSEYGQLMQCFGYDPETHEVSYNNAGNVVGDFSVHVPVNFSYTWGDKTKTVIKYVVTINVTRTQGNSNRK